ncbi:MAG TPA: hypothetical protein VHE35_27505 [Kofleriaceae bacterium]|nr:hypothetical protein [Kofleriaceae bacterium]
MLQARAHPAAVLLADGTVLACGGADVGHEPLASCERYDPRTDRWTPAASMDRPRSFFPMVRLADGRVLVVGGASTAGATPAELYEPARDRWSPIAPVARPATGASLTALPAGGAMLVAGSQAGNDVHDDSFLLDARTGAWRDGPALRLGRQAHCAAWTDDGLVVAGGRGQYEPCWPTEWLCLRGGGAPSLRSVERLGPRASRWKAGRDAPVPLPYCRTTVVGPHAFLAVESTKDQSARYDSARDRWQVLASPGRALSTRAVAPLPGGGAIAVGGFPARDAPEPTASLLLAPGADHWTWGPPLAVQRTWTTAVPLADGRVLVLGGAPLRSGAVADVELYEP